jgi:hypothetical protein
MSRPERGDTLNDALYLRVPYQLRRRVETLARREFRSLGNMVRVLIERGLHALGDADGRAPPR